MATNEELADELADSMESRIESGVKRWKAGPREVEYVEADKQLTNLLTLRALANREANGAVRLARRCDVR